MVDKKVRLKSSNDEGGFDYLYPATKSKIVDVNGKNLDETLNEVTTQLAQTEKELAEKASKTDTVSLQNQMNTVVASAGNPTASSAEITQARNDNKGSSFSTLQSHLLNFEKILYENKRVYEFSDWVNGSIQSATDENSLSTYIKTREKHYIDVGTNIEIDVLNGYKLDFIEYDESLMFVRRQGFSTNKIEKKVEYPYFRLCIGLDDVTPLTQNAKNNLVFTYETETIVSKESKQRTSEIIDLFSKGLLPYELSVFEQGSILSDGSESNSNQYFIKSKEKNNIEVGKKLKISLSNNYQARIYWYDELGNYKTRNENYYTGATEIIANYPLFKIMLTLDSTTPVATEIASNLKVEQVVSETTIGDELKLKGKTVYGFGTSITNGHLLSLGYLEHMQEDEQFLLTNYARNGHTVRGDSATSIITQINNASSTVPDYIVFDGNANDTYPTVANDPIILGEISTGYTATLDINTYCGAFETICKTLLTKYVGSQIIYVGVHKLVARDLESQNKLHDLNVEMCRKWGIAVVDLYHESNFNSFLIDYKNNYSYDAVDTITMGSGTHPNEVGYRKFYIPPIKAKMLELLES